MEKISEITPEQWTEVYRLREEWRAVGTCTAPAQRGPTENVIASFYAKLGRATPKFLWFDGPLSCVVLGPLVLSIQNESGDLREDLLANLAAIESEVLPGSQKGGQLAAILLEGGGPSASPTMSAQVRAWLDAYQSTAPALTKKVWALREWGCEYAWWVAHYDVCRHVVGVQYDNNQNELLDLWVQLMQGAGWWFPGETVCFAAERHDHLSFDDEHRLHCADGPAIECRDGFRIYAWHGTVVPAEWIEHRETLDPATALTWPNIEQRRAAAEILGWHRILDHLSPRIIDTDEDPQIGMLMEVDLPDAPASRFLKVVCGTGRTFALPVPPECKTALEANAWTYDLRPEDLLGLEVRT